MKSNIRRNAFLLGLVILFLSKGQAQQYVYDLSDRADISRIYTFSEHLVSTDKNHYLYFNSDEGITVMRYDMDFKNEFKDEIKTESRDVQSMALKYNSGQLAWFTCTTNYNEKQFEYELTTMDLDGNMSRPKGIADLRYKSEKRIPEYSFSYSEDSSKMLMVLEIDFERTDEYSAYIAVFDADFNKIYEKDFYPDVSQRQFDKYNWDVANDGKVYLSAIVFNDDTKDFDKKVKGKQVQDYKSMVYQFSADSKKEIELKVADHFVKSANIIAGSDSNPLISYAYGYRDSDPIEGFKFSLRDAAEFNEITNDELAFDIKSLETYSSLEYIKNKRGVGLRPTFEFYESKVAEDGSFDVMLDYHFVVVSRNNYTGGYGGFGSPGYETTTFFDASMFLIRLSKEGVLERKTLLPRRFGSSTDGNTGSSMVGNSDNTVLFYNDNEINLEDNINAPSRRLMVTSHNRGNFVMANINSLNQITRSIVFNFNDEDLILIPSAIKKIGKDRYFFAAYDSGSLSNRYRFGLFDVIND